MKDYVEYSKMHREVGIGENTEGLVVRSTLPVIKIKEDQGEQTIGFKRHLDRIEPDVQIREAPENQGEEEEKSHPGEIHQTAIGFARDEIFILGRGIFAKRSQTLFGDKGSDLAAIEKTESDEQAKDPIAHPEIAR